MIIIKENIKNIDEFNYLYDMVGWGRMIIISLNKL